MSGEAAVNAQHKTQEAKIPYALSIFNTNDMKR